MTPPREARETSLARRTLAWPGDAQHTRVLQTFPKRPVLPAEPGEAPIRTSPLSRLATRRLPENNEQFLARRYRMYLPTEAEFRAEFARDCERAERALQAIAEPAAERPSQKGTR